MLVCIKCWYSDRVPLQGDSRQPCTMLWSDGMSAAQARKALFGSNMYGGKSSGSDVLGTFTSSDAVRILQKLFVDSCTMQVLIAK